MTGMVARTSTDKPATLRELTPENWTSNFGVCMTQTIMMRISDYQALTDVEGWPFPAAANGGAKALREGGEAHMALQPAFPHKSAGARLSSG